MEKEKKTLVDWVKEHKKELFIAGVNITVIIAVVIGIKNHNAIEDVWASLKKMLEKKQDVIPVTNTVSPADVAPLNDIVEIGIVKANRTPHDVSQHLRNLSEGRKASAEKIATATEYGYDLHPGQTWVKAYRTGENAA